MWLAAQRAAVTLTALVTLGILTRTLPASDFGLVAAATALLPFAYLFADSATVTYLVQRSTANQLILSTAFWAAVGAGGILTIVLLGAAGPIAALLGQPQLDSIIRTLSVAVILGSLAAVPNAILKRRMAFRWLATRSVVGIAVGQVFAVMLALSGAGLWALVFQVIISQAVLCAMTWWAARWRPSFAFSKAELVSLVRFGAKIVTVELLAIGRLWAEVGLILTALGPSALGFLNIANRLIQTVTSLGAGTLLPVSTVTFAKIREDLPRLRRAYQVALRTSYGVSTPLFAMLALSAPVLVPLLFGSEWHESVPLVQILSVSAVFILAANLDLGFFYALGRPGTWLIYAVVVEALTILVVASVVDYGIVAVAIGVTAVSVCAAACRPLIVRRPLSTSVRDIIRPLRPVLVSASAATTMGAVVSATFPRSLPVAFVVAVATAVGGTYLLLLRVTGRDTMLDVVSSLPVHGRLHQFLAKVAGG